MKEHRIEIEFDDEGNIKAETFGMEGAICADELDKVLKGIKGERKVENTPDYYKSQTSKQTIRRS